MRSARLLSATLFTVGMVAALPVQSADLAKRQSSEEPLFAEEEQIVKALQLLQGQGIDFEKVVEVTQGIIDGEEAAAAGEAETSTNVPVVFTPLAQTEQDATDVGALQVSNAAEDSSDETIPEAVVTAANSNDRDSTEASTNGNDRDSTEASTNSNDRNDRDSSDSNEGEGFFDSEVGRTITSTVGSVLDDQLGTDGLASGIISALT